MCFVKLSFTILSLTQRLMPIELAFPKIKTMKKSFTTLLAFICICLNVSNAQSLAVNNDGSTADASAILDIKSSTKGLLIPRVSTTGSITSPATGLIIYVTTGTVGFYYNAGTPSTPSWKLILPSDGSGSALTNLSAANLTGTLPAISGVNLTSLNASNLGSGTVSAARMPAFTGDVTTTAGAVATTIANNAVTTTKIADGNVTVAKISATGTASGTTYLRGDGSWSTPSGGGGATLILTATNTTASISIPASGGAGLPGLVDASFNTYSAPTSGSFNGTTFTASVAGIYLITVSIKGVGGIVNPSINLQLNSTTIAVAPSISSANFSPTMGKSTISMVVSLANTDAIKINIENSAATAGCSFSSDGTTRLVIVKL